MLVLFMMVCVPFVGARSSKIAKILQKRIRVSFPLSLPAPLKLFVLPAHRLALS